jgi:probable FeS assembly SUF system protein SufT
MEKKMVVNLARDVDAIAVPDGDEVTLPKGQLVRILQEMGDSFTVMNPIGMRFRVEGKDADALEREPPKEEAAAKPVDLTQEGVKSAIVDELKRIYDPEIPFNIYDLGLVYGIELDAIGEKRYNVGVRMTLTAPGCGIGDVLVADVQKKVAKVPGVKEVDVELVFDPPWDFSKMAPEVRMQLNL